MIYMLFILVTILLVLSAVAFKMDVSAPAFMLNAAFEVAAFCACLYENKWEFQEKKLVVLIMTGLSSFLIFSWLTFVKDKHKKKTLTRELIPINVSSIKLLVYLIFQSCLYLAVFELMLKNVGKEFIGSNFPKIIGEYYNINHTGTISYYSKIINIGQIINFSGIYYMLYLMINNIICKVKNKIILYINIIIGIMGSLITGTKTSFYMFVVSGIIMFIVLKSKKEGWRRNINFKVFIKFTFILILLLISFGLISILQGRTLDNMKMIDTIATYIGSPMKNLEIFINENIFSRKIFGGVTFMSIYSDLYKLTGNISFKVENLYKYRWINGNGLGNVYTIFMPLYNDFGIAGTFIIMGIIGIYTQKIYDKLKYRKKIIKIDFYVIYYSYLAFSVIFSFFSNKFFESIISKAGIYFLIGIYLIDLFFMRLNVNRSKIILEK